MLKPAGNAFSLRHRKQMNIEVVLRHRANKSIEVLKTGDFMLSYFKLVALGNRL